MATGAMQQAFLAGAGEFNGYRARLLRPNPNDHILHCRDIGAGNHSWPIHLPTTPVRSLFNQPEVKFFRSFEEMYQWVHDRELFQLEPAVVARFLGGAFADSDENIEVGDDVLVLMLGWRIVSRTVLPISFVTPIPCSIRGTVIYGVLLDWLDLAVETARGGD